MSPHSTLGALGNLDLAVEWFGWCFVQVTLFAAAVAVVYRLTCQQRAGRNVVLLAAALATVGLLTLASASPWPRWNFNLFTAGDQSSDDRLPAVGDGASGLIDQQVRRSDAATDIDGDGHWNRSNRDAVEPAAAINGEAANANLPALNEDGPSWSYYVVAAAWLAASFGLLRLLVGLVYLRLHRRSSRPIKDAELRAWFGELCERLHVAAPVELRESAPLEVAATIGWRRPLVLLPSSWREWTADQRRAVLAHELSHVAERHVPQWLVSQVATVPHFYHPLVHWLGRRLRLEQELAADDLAARTLGSRRRYADALAGLALGARMPAGPLTTLGLFMSRPLLMRRIVMLRNPTVRRRHSKGFSYFFALAVVALAAAGAAGLRAASPTKDDVDAPATSATETTTTVPDAAPREAISPAARPLQSVVSDLFGITGRSRCTATALFQVARQRPRLVNDSPPVSDSDWQILCRTQLALLKSNHVLGAALRVPGVANLPLLAKQTDPRQWLANRLDVGFVRDSEILYIRLAGDAGDAEQLKIIVDAVTKAYQDEVVFADDQRQQVTRDALAKSLTRLNHEIAEKTETYFALARELGIGQSGRAQVMQQLDIGRLERVDVELMRLEERQLQAKMTASDGEPSREQVRLKDFLTERIAQLRNCACGSRSLRIESHAAVTNPSS